jgi:HSP20 family protein
MPWDPVRDLLTMQERLESLFGRATPGWVPPADIVERPDAFVVSIELPGLRRDDVQIDGHTHGVTVSGHRPSQTSCPERFEQLERGQGQFSRTFRFGMPISIDRITAELTHGVLTITAPKAAEPPSQIPVR